MQRSSDQTTGAEILGDRYAVGPLVAAGGVGLIHVATDRTDGRRVALKRLKWHRDTMIDRARFVREARLLAQLRHPHLVAALDFGFDANRAPYLVLELLEGETLADRLERVSVLEPAEALRLLFPALGAIAYLHERKVVHRDLKPSNLFLDQRADGECVKVIDLGLARGHDDGTLTHTGGFSGTPAFVSPEQANGGAASPASDVWAMGVVLFRVLSGSLPFSGESALAIVAQIASRSAPTLTDVAPELPRAFSTAVDRALQRDPGRRYANIRQFAHALVDAAVSCNIPVPDDPEPIGLPEYFMWVAAARDGSTLGTAELRVAAPGVASSSPAGRPWRAALLSLLVVGVAIYLGTEGFSRATGSGQVGSAPASGSVDATGRVLSSGAPTEGHAVEALEPGPAPSSSSSECGGDEACEGATEVGPPRTSGVPPAGRTSDSPRVRRGATTARGSRSGTATTSPSSNPRAPDTQRRDIPVSDMVPWQNGPTGDAPTEGIEGELQQW